MKFSWGNTLKEQIFRAVLCLAVLVSALSVLFILGFLLYFTRPLFSAGGWGELISLHWRPFQGQFGIVPMIVGSLCLAVVSLLLAYPFALGICCFAHGLGPLKPARFVMAVIQFMTSIPTVVYGFVSIFLLVPFLREMFSHGTGYSLLAAVLMLSILILPTIVLVLHSQFEIIEPAVRVTVAALGMTPSQKLLLVVLPASSGGMFAAAVLGFGRAVGDTIIALMVAGNAPQIPHSPLDSIRALTSHIALVVATDSTSPAYLSLFACGLLLLVVAVLVNLVLHWIRRRALPIGVDVDA